LFRRHTRAVALTQEGAELLPVAATMSSAESAAGPP